jgi:hypothetical protein
MRRSNRSLRSGGFAALIVLAAILACAAPTVAAPSSQDETAGLLADHVTDCNVSFDPSGDVLIDGSALTGAEAALLDALLLTDASLAAALDAAADADADACVNLTIDVLGASVALNADVAACGSVTAEAGVITVGGVEIGSDLLAPELSDVLTAAALADADACTVITVTDNETLVDAFATICAMATLLDTGVVSVVIGTDEFFFDGTLIDASGLLDVGVTAEINLTVTASLDVATDTVELTIVAAECVAGGAPTPPGGGSPSPGGGSPSPVPPGGGGGSPSPGTSPSSPPVIPDTASWPGNVSAAVVLAVLLMLSLIAQIATPRMRNR